jgi:glycosyltransferase involved in cell wall biosynthesis
MRRLANEDPLRWVIVGGGTKKAELENFVQTQRIGNAVLRPYQPRGRLGELLALGDVHLVTMANEFEGLMVPSKFYGVLAAGRPLIFIGPRSSEVARVVIDEGCGIVVDPGDGQGLSDAVQALRRDPDRAREMGMRGRRVLVERYDTRRACEIWHSLLHRIVEVHA